MSTLWVLVILALVPDVSTGHQVTEMSVYPDKATCESTKTDFLTKAAGTFPGGEFSATCVEVPMIARLS